MAVKPRTKEHSEAISKAIALAWKQGKYANKKPPFISEDHKRNISKAMKKQWAEGVFDSRKHKGMSGLRHSEETKGKMFAAHTGRAPSQRGYRVSKIKGYFSLHERVVAVRGRAATHACVDCHKNASDWSSNTEEYKSVGEFSPRCRHCHQQYDRKLHLDRISRR